MTDIVVDRLRIRGADARRLAAVATRALPAALEQALADLADADLGRLTVRLADPAEHDDATLAILWADAIRQAALAAGARLRTAPSSHGDFGDRREEGDHREESADDPSDGPVAAVSAWLVRLDSGEVAPPPIAVVALADHRVSLAVLRRIGVERATRLVRALTAASDRTGMAPWPLPSGRSPEQRSSSRLDDNDGNATPAALASLAIAVAHAAQALRPLLGLGGAAHVDPAAAPAAAASTRAAGIVLPYPWLADLCRTAADLHPAAEPSHPRRVALAALADPGDPYLADDPLVRLLAGAPEDATPAAGLAPLDALPEIHAAADTVLRQFAALLPGFARSTVGFVRESWLLRPGLLDLARDPVALVARTAPLDVVLPSLPYPVGLLRLPWTPAVTVRFRS